MAPKPSPGRRSTDGPRDRPNQAGFRQNGAPGKRAVVYCTYAVDPGRTLDKLVALVEEKGAEVIGGFALVRHDLAADVSEFVDRLTPALVD